METWSERAVRYRERAEEMLALAETMKNQDARAHMRRAGQDYLDMAAQAERSARGEKSFPKGQTSFPKDG
jgi:hypothetical protein